MDMKFRAWDKNHELMNYIDDLYWFENNGVHNFGGNGTYTDYDIMLYSGMNDSKRTDEFPLGRKVYENDIIKDLDENIYEVIFLNGMFLARPISEDITLDHLTSVLASGAYVVGNIYEGEI